MSDPARKMSLLQATMLVAGNMIGTGLFLLPVNLAVILVVVPYIYASAAVVKVVYDHKVPRRTFQLFKWIAVVAVLYCLGTVWGGDPQTVVHAMVALLFSVPLYLFFIRSMEAARQRKEAS